MIALSAALSVVLSFGMASYPRLATNLAGHQLRSPILLAAGTAGISDEMGDVLSIDRLGGIVTKSVTKEPRDGNRFPRITFTRAGMINAIGLANPGIEAFITESSANINACPTTMIGSVAGDSIEDYVSVAQSLADIDGVKVIELNVSCPNVHSGLEFGAEPSALAELVQAVRAGVGETSLFVKLSPITVGTPHTIVDLARVAVEAGADGLTLTNTVPAMGIDVMSKKPILSNGTGGLSGPAIHPIVVRLVHLVYSQFAKEANIPIMAVGGVTRWEDAAEFVLAGASAVQIGAGNFADPRIALKVTKGLDRWVAQMGSSNVSELVGAVEL